MRKFSYIINSPNGIHARPAGILVKASSKFKSDIKLYKGEQKANAKSLFSIMGLGVKEGDCIDVEISGDDEDMASESIENILQDSFNAIQIVKSEGSDEIEPEKIKKIIKNNFNVVETEETTV